MSRDHYDPTIPSVTEVIKPLHEGALDNIPRQILDAKAKLGTENHGAIEAWLRGQVEIGDSVVLNLASQAFKRVGRGAEEHIEEYFVNDGVCQGTPDYWWTGEGQLMVDYKFTAQLNNVVAVQLIGYATLLDISPELYVFWFCDYGVSVYRVNLSAANELYLLFRYLLVHYEAIKKEGVELLEALTMWEQIQEDYVLLQLEDTFFPPLSITSMAQVENACVMYDRLYTANDKLKLLKSEIKRYMVQENIPSLELDGGKLKLRIQVSDRGEYSVPARITRKWKEEKERYRVGTNESVSLVFVKNKKGGGAR